MDRNFFLIIIILNCIPAYYIFSLFGSSPRVIPYKTYDIGFNPRCFFWGCIVQVQVINLGILAGRKSPVNNYESKLTAVRTHTPVWHWFQRSNPRFFCIVEVQVINLGIENHLSKIMQVSSHQLDSIPITCMQVRRCKRNSYSVQSLCICTQRGYCTKNIRLTRDGVFIQKAKMVLLASSFWLVWLCSGLSDPP